MVGVTRADLSSSADVIRFFNTLAEVPSIYLPDLALRLIRRAFRVVLASWKLGRNDWLWQQLG